MNRREFLQLTNKIVLGATGAALLPLPALPSRKVEYLEDIKSELSSVARVADTGHDERRLQISFGGTGKADWGLSPRQAARNGRDRQRRDAKLAPTLAWEPY